MLVIFAFLTFFFSVSSSAPILSHLDNEPVSPYLTKFTQRDSGFRNMVTATVKISSWGKVAEREDIFQIRAQEDTTFVTFPDGGHILEKFPVDVIGGRVLDIAKKPWHENDQHFMDEVQRIFSAHTPVERLQVAADLHTVAERLERQ